MNKQKYQNSTALSKHIWSLKDNNVPYSIKWSVQKKATAYKNTTGKCYLCLAEKVTIIKADKTKSLNKRTELVVKCRHKNRFYLKSFHPPNSNSQ